MWILIFVEILRLGPNSRLATTSRVFVHMIKIIDNKENFNYPYLLRKTAHFVSVKFCNQSEALVARIVITKVVEICTPPIGPRTWMPPRVRMEIYKTDAVIRKQISSSCTC